MSYQKRGRAPKDRYESMYLPADEYVIINEDDSVLIPVVLKLPKPPDIKLIDGYGEHPLSQVFKRLKTPPKIKEIENEAAKELRGEKKSNKHEAVTGYKIITRFWEIFDSRHSELQEEIKFIKSFWWYCINGYWVFIKGKPTWIPPWYFFYLHICYMEEEKDHYPQYRDDNRKAWIYEWYNYTTHETFRDLDEDGCAVKVDGKYHMKKMADRTSIGTQEAKRRRCGATMGMVLRLIYIAVTQRGVKCTLSSFTADAVKKKIYKPIMLPTWQKMPICFKPINNMSNTPGAGLEFTAPRGVYYTDALNSSILLPDSNKVTEADGGKYHGMGRDEQGKIKRIVGERWESDKLTLTQESRIHGYANHPSTVEEMEEGGLEYMQMWKESNFYIRRPNGQTFSGLANYFFKASSGRGGFIDYWGLSVVESPTEEQIKFAPKNATYAASRIGAKEYLRKERDALLRKGDPDSLEKYRITRRKEPIDSTECFMGTSGSMGFNIQVLDNRIKELDIKEETVTGNLEWVGGNPTSGIVEWLPHPEGKYDNSLVLGPNESNLKYPGQIYSVKQAAMVPSYTPMYPTRFVAGADPFGFSNLTEAKRLQRRMRLSDGGGAVIMNRQATDTDPDMRLWEGPRFVLTYRNLPESLIDYCDDMLKMAVYYSCFLFVEGNKKDRLWEYCIDNGYGNYMGYMTTPDGKIKDTPGVYLLGQEKNDLFSLLKDYIQYRGHKEKHKRLLVELREMTGPEMLNKSDLSAAAGQCLFGIKSQYLQYHEQQNVESTFDVMDILKMPYI